MSQPLNIPPARYTVRNLLDFLIAERYRGTITDKQGAVIRQAVLRVAATVQPGDPLKLDLAVFDPANSTAPRVPRGPAVQVMREALVSFASRHRARGATSSRTVRAVKAPHRSQNADVIPLRTARPVDMAPVTGAHLAAIIDAADDLNDLQKHRGTKALAQVLGPAWRTTDLRRVDLDKALAALNLAPSTVWSVRSHLRYGIDRYNLAHPDTPLSVLFERRRRFAYEGAIEPTGRGLLNFLFQTHRQRGKTESALERELVGTKAVLIALFGPHWAAVDLAKADLSRVDEVSLVDASRHSYKSAFWNALRTYDDMRPAELGDNGRFARSHCMPTYGTEYPPTIGGALNLLRNEPGRVPTKRASSARAATRVVAKAAFGPDWADTPLADLDVAAAVEATGAEGRKATYYRTDVRFVLRFYATRMSELEAGAGPDSGPGRGLTD